MVPPLDEATGVADYEFTCGDCGASILVDEGARALLAEEGCAVCGADPAPAAFAPTEPDGA